MPEVSIIIPVHNSAESVRRAVSSILDQSVLDIEVIVIDDASNDNSGDVVRSMADRRIRLYANGENQGVARSLNIGLELAKSPIIARMDADDASYPDRLRRQLDYLHSNPAVSVCGGWARYKGGYHGLICRTPVGADCVKASLVFDNPIIHPSVAIRKSAMDMHSFRYDPSHSRCEDYELWARMSKVTALDNLPEVLIDYTVHTSSVTSTARPEMEGQTLCLQKKLLADIGIECDDQMLLFHRAIGHGAAVGGCSELHRAEDWLKRIIAGNCKAGVYSGAGMQHAASHAWSKLCFNNARQGLSAYRIWKNSELLIGNGCPPLERSKFLFRSLLFQIYRRSGKGC